MNQRFERRKATVPLAARIVDGVAAGMAASFITSLFQGVWTKLRLPPTDLPSTEPPTEVLADEVYRTVTGNRMTPKARIVAGEAVHYAMGVTLGVTYVLASRRWPGIAAARGAAYGLGIWATIEEGGLAILGLKPPPWTAERAEHVFAASSHLVFGMVLARYLKSRRSS